jgi:hypothetical protein
MKSVIKYSLIALLALVSTQCKNGRKATESTDKVVSAPAQPTAPAAIKTSKAMDEPEVASEPRRSESEMPLRPEPRSTDSLFFKMQRTPCFGQCSVYTIHIYKSGYATLEGRKFFEHIGNFRTQVSAEDMKTIEQWASEANYFDLDHQYDAPVTDLPTTITIMQVNGRKQWVYNRMNSPDELRKFERSIEDWIKPIAWTAYEPKPEKVEE